MANLVGPLTPTVQYVDPATGKFTQQGLIYFSNLVSTIGVIPAAPPASANIPNGTSFFDATTNTLFVWNGSAWKKVVLT